METPDTGAPCRHTLFNRYFISIWIINLAAYTSHSAMNNLAAVYVKHTGGSTLVSGYLAFFFAIFAIAARFVCGSLSDRIGRRALLALSCIVMGVGVICFGLIPSLFLMLIFRGFQGFGFSTNGQTVSAATADVMPKEKMGLGFGIMWLGQALAAIAAATLVSDAIAAGNYRTIFFTLTALLALGTLLSFQCNYEKKPEYQSCRPASAPAQRGIWKYMEPKALPSACMLVFLSGGMVGVSHFLFYYSTEIGYPTPERFFFVSATFMLLSNLFTARYSDRVHPLALMAPSLAGGVLCNVLLAAAIGNPAVLMPLAGVFHGFSLGIGFPMLNQIAVKASPASRRGAASATFYLAMDIGVGGFAVLWGWALDNWSFRTAYGGAAITIAISLALCFFFLGRKKHPFIRK